MLSPPCNFLTVILSSYSIPIINCNESDVVLHSIANGSCILVSYCPVLRNFRAGAEILSFLMARKSERWWLYRHSMQIIDWLQ